MMMKKMRRDGGIVVVIVVVVVVVGEARLRCFGTGLVWHDRSESGWNRDQSRG